MRKFLRNLNCESGFKFPVIIALSSLGYLDKLKRVFNEVLIPKTVYEEVCVKGREPVGSYELVKAIKNRVIEIKTIKTISKKLIKVIEPLKKTVQ